MKDDFQVLKELKRIKKINGQVRKCYVEINDPVVAEYAVALDQGRGRNQKQNYHFSDGDGSQIDYFNDPAIKASIDGMVSGGRRHSEELDEISLQMAKLAARKSIEFVESGAHRNYQYWKGTNNENLVVSGKLRDSIVGVAYRNDKEIGRGR